MRKRILPISAIIILVAPLSAFSPPSSSGSIISRHCQQSNAAGIVTTKKKKDINLLQHRRRHRRDLHTITTSLALDSNSGNSNNNVVDDLWTTGSSDIEIEMSDLNLSSNNNNNNDEDDDVKKGSTHEIVLLTNGSNNQEIISSLDTTTTTTTNNSLKENDDNSDITTKYIFLGGTIVILIVAGVLAMNMGNDLGIIDLELGQLIKDPSNSFDTILSSLETMDITKGMLYFSSFYILAEILAIPAVPIMTASSGFLFGTVLGTITCLFSASVAASISFVIGRTLLRGYVERVLKDKPKFQNLDRAIGTGGFKLMLLLRLSPLFPFALSNYLYGASSIPFVPYFFGTLLGFAPGTFAYVYAGRIGKVLTVDSASSEPWYVYVGGLAVVVVLLKFAGDVASSVIESLDEEDGDGWDGNMD